MEFSGFVFEPESIAAMYVAFVGAGLIAGALAIGFTAFGRR